MKHILIIIGAAWALAGCVSPGILTPQQQIDPKVYSIVNDFCINQSGLQSSGVIEECATNLVTPYHHEGDPKSIVVEIQSDGSLQFFHQTPSAAELKSFFAVYAQFTPQPIIKITLPQNAGSDTIQNSLRMVLDDAQSMGLEDILILSLNRPDSAIEMRLRQTLAAIVQPGDRAPAVRQQASLQYPLTEQGAHHSGTTLLVAELDEEGRVIDVKINHSSGYDSLDNSCISTVKASSFWPRLSNGAPQKSVISFPCRFELKIAQ